MEGAVFVNTSVCKLNEVLNRDRCVTGAELYCDLTEVLDVYHRINLSDLVCIRFILAFGRIVVFGCSITSREGEYTCYQKSKSCNFDK